MIGFSNDSRDFCQAETNQQLPREGFDFPPKPAALDNRPSRPAAIDNQLDQCKNGLGWGKPTAPGGVGQVGLMRILF